jgi:hypothetical protein
VPSLAVRFIRTAMLSLLGGTLLGAFLLAGEPAIALGFRPLHVELLLVGWGLQLAFGVAYWILPKHATRAPARGAELPIRLAWWLLNGGVWVAGLGLSLGTPPWWVGIGRLSELCAVLLFASNAWSRIKPFGAGRPQTREVA